MTYVIIGFIGEYIDYKNLLYLECNSRDFIGVTSEPIDEWTCQQCSQLKRSNTHRSSLILNKFINTHFNIKEHFSALLLTRPLDNRKVYMDYML